MLSGERLLIVEEEFLIALDIQRVLEDAHAQTAVFCRNFSEVEALADRLSEFDLAIVNPPSNAAAFAMAERLLAAGVAVVVCSAFSGELKGTALETAEFVGKPFSDDELLTACRRALAQRKPA